MRRYPESEDEKDRQPLMWLHSYPVYASYLIVTIFVVSTIVTTGFMAFGSPGWFKWLTLDTGDVLRGQVWRILSYGLVNPPSLWFASSMFLLAWFGKDLEKFLGRRIFLQLYAGLYLLPPVLLTLVGVRWPMILFGETGALAVFVCFATLNPMTALYFGILSWWLAAVLVGIYTLMHLAYHDPARLLALWITTAFAFAFARFQQGRITLPGIKLWSRKPKLRVLPDLTPDEMRRAQAQRPPSKSMAEMDALLDKIARSGLGSLTAKERARLEQSRAEILKSRGPGGAPRSG